MGRINWSRVFLGGIVAAVVIFVVEWLVYGLILAEDYRRAMESINRTPSMSAGTMAIYAAISLLMGWTAVWLYAAARPRFGPGPGTAGKVALAVWVVGYALPLMGWIPADIFSTKLVVVGLICGLIEIELATQAGAWVYKEGPSA